MLTSIVGNILVIVVLKKTKEFRNSQSVYKMSIAISDIVWSLGICIVTSFIVDMFGSTIYTCKISDMTSTLVNINNFIVYRDVYCEVLNSTTDKKNWLLYFYLILAVLSGLLIIISLTVSLVSLIFAAADRYFALAFPLKYKCTNTIKLAKISSAFVWISSIILHTVTIFVDLNFQFYNIFLRPSYSDVSSNEILLSALVFVMFFLLWLLTFLTLVSLYKSYKRSLKLNRRTRKKISLEKQMSLVLTFMVVAFTFSLSPTLYNHALKYIKSKYFSNVDPLISFSFLITNSFWNIIVYNVLNKKFRTAFKALFRKTN